MGLLSTLPRSSGMGAIPKFKGRVVILSRTGKVFGEIFWAVEAEYFRTEMTFSVSKNNLC